MPTLYTSSEIAPQEKLNLIDLWKNKLNHHISSGSKLHEEKHRPPPQEYNVVHPQNKVSTECNMKQDNKLRYQKSYTIIRHFQECGNKRSRKKNCPLRIAELAAPSKRHCFDTWRNRSSALPYYMVDRLKQRALDQKPIVQVSDAVECFKRSKSKSRKIGTHYKKSTKRNKCKLLCAVFGYKIMKLLEKPQSVTLSPYFERIALFVDACVSAVLCNSVNKINFNKHKEIQKDVVNKITVWIASILDESSYNMLLDDLEELEEQEGPVLDLLDELINNVLIICKQESDRQSTRSDDGSYKSEESINSGKYGNDVQDSDFTKDNESIAYTIHPLLNDIFLALIENVIYDQSATDDSFNNYINNLVDTFFTNAYNICESKQQSNLDETHTVENQIQDTPNTESKDYDLQKDGENNNANISPIETDINKPYLLDSTDNETNLLENIYNNNERLNEQNEKTNEILDDENEATGAATDTPDDSNKQVTFSSLNIDDSRDLVALIKSLEKNDKNVYVKNLPKERSIISITLSTPNPFLLSDADESWPEDLQFPVSKSLSNINKSTISLGLIAESEEYEILSEKSSAKNKQNWMNKENDWCIEAQNPLFNNIVYSDYSKLEEANEVETKNGLQDQNNLNNLKSNLKYINENLTQPDDSKIDDVKHSGTTLRKNVTVGTPTNIINTSSNKTCMGSTQRVPAEKTTVATARSLIEEQFPIHKKIITKCSATTITSLTITKMSVQKIVKRNIQNLPNFDISPGKLYIHGQKIHRNALKMDHKHPYEFHRDKYKEWCLGLLNVTDNLDIWAEWIENTTNQMEFLKKFEGHQEVACCSKTITIRGDSGKWLKLIKDIDVDTKLLLRRGRRLLKGLRHYRSYYMMPYKCMCHRRH